MSNSIHTYTHTHTEACIPVVEFVPAIKEAMKKVSPNFCFLENSFHAGIINPLKHSGHYMNHLL
jgi:hypothetical protein